MTTAAQTITRNAPETDSRKTQVTVSRAIHVLSTEDQPRQVMTHRDRTCRNLESGENPDFSQVLGHQKFVAHEQRVPAQQKATQWWGLQSRERPVLRTTSR